jgi:hypothetical protein
MWYLAEIIFAAPSSEKKKMCMCETSSVLIMAETANLAYEKSIV